MAVNVLIADDHPLVRRILQRLLIRQPEIGHCTTVENQKTLNEALITGSVDVVIVNEERNSATIDYSQRFPLKQLPGVKLIVMSLNTDRRYVKASLRAGAVGYIVKSSAYEEMPAAISCVSQGNMYIGSEINGEPECRPLDMAKFRS